MLQYRSSKRYAFIPKDALNIKNSAVNYKYNILQFGGKYRHLQEK